jgi:hypothetical protein
VSARREFAILIQKSSHRDSIVALLFYSVLAMTFATTSARTRSARERRRFPAIEVEWTLYHATERLLGSPSWRAG